VRIFKEESELEVWKQDTTSHFQILKVYPICRWSGDLGPKVHEGDRQAPEGFYTITPDLMQPNSNYYLAINTGFPNTYDKANDRHGAFLMIHGDCSSRGCYAMTDEQIGEIYSLARESFLGGQQSFQVQAYPFRMTPANLARHHTNPNMAFWRMIKEGSDHFEVSHLEPKVEVCNRHYVFDAAPPANSSKPLVFNPTDVARLTWSRLRSRRWRWRKSITTTRSMRRRSNHPVRRADPYRPRRRHEPGVPGAGRRQHSAGACSAAGTAAAAARRRRQRVTADASQPLVRRSVRFQARRHAGRRHRGGDAGARCRCERGAKTQTRAA